MKFKLHIFNLIILFLIIKYSNEKQLEVTVIIKIAIVNKNQEQVNKKFSFEIYCELIKYN